MAHHKSARKRIRRNERKRISNKSYMSAVRTTIKQFRTAAEGLLEGQGSVETVRPLFQSAQVSLAKAAQKGLVHKNNASRRIGRLAGLLKRAEEGAASGVTATAKKKTTKKKTTKKKASKKKTSKKKK